MIYPIGTFTIPLDDMGSPDAADADTITFGMPANGPFAAGVPIGQRMLDMIADAGVEQTRRTEQLKLAPSSLDAQRIASDYVRDMTVYTAVAKTFVTTVKTVTQSN